MIDFLSMSITNGILIILLITVLIFFCLYIYNDNQRLKEENSELRKENKSLLEKKIITKENVDSVSIKNISGDKAINRCNKLTDDLNEKENLMNSYKYYNSSEGINTNVKLEELISRKDLSSMKTKGYDYLEEISNKISEELKPKTIELTEYEKKQEEQAVISYKELLKFKDNQLYDEKQETINFIEELKKLRNNLK